MKSHVLNFTKIFSLLLCFECIAVVTNAQNAVEKDTLYLGGMTVVVKRKPMPPKDTLYYLLDLKKTPPNDKMITVDSESVYNFYQVNCHCLEDKLSPVFRYNGQIKTTLTADKIVHIHFISLAELIDTVKTQGFDNFNRTKALFFIIPDRGYS